MIDKLIKRGVSIKNSLVRYRTGVIDKIKYYLDDLYVSDNSILVRGWVVSTDGRDISPSIVFKSGNEIKAFDLKLSRRDDVTESLGCENVKCGFNFEASFKSGKNGRIYLQYILSGKTRRIVIGAFCGSEFYSGLEVNHILSGIPPFSAVKNSVVARNFQIPQRLYDFDVDIIVPVYNGFEYFERLFSTIAKTSMNHRVYVINDCSPDERVMPYLVKYAKNNDNVILIENKENLGFVQSVNKALAVSKADVAIVNTDVILPDKWLERLMIPIIMQNDIASSTPFTNSGTICSFPNFCENNDIFLGLDVDDIDSEFSKIKPLYNTMPTGVGFCMGMKRDVINKIGTLNAEVFYKGYGEENDWCQRAINAGYKNVMVENLFVWHKHGGSFLSEDKQRYIERNLRLLNQMHPNYDRDVQIYCKRDPAKNIREYVKWQLINRSVSDCYVVFNHNWGGGASSYIDDKIKGYMADGFKVIQIICDVNNGLIVEIDYKNEKTQFLFNSFEDIYGILENTPFTKIIINEIVSFDDIEGTMEFILKLKSIKNAELIMLCHDFYGVCPSIYLLDKDDKHCFKPDISVCRECFPTNSHKMYNACEGAEKWRKLWKNFLTQCDEVRFFSENTKSYYEHWYGNISTATVVPHQVNYIQPVKPFKKENKTVTIALIGNLMKTKGADILYEMSKIIKRNNIDARIVVIGPDLEACKDKSIIIHGRYKREELPTLIEKYRVDVVFIASIWPETFSYTTEEAIKMNVPVAAFNMGAPAERLVHYSKSILIDEISGKAALDKIMEYVKAL